jgi:glycosyltransferase involved in cell wall biosynthesis
VSGGRPRIAVDLRALVGQPTGIGRFTLELLRELARRGGADYLGVAHAELSVREELARAGVPFERQPAPLGVLWQQLSLPRRLAREDLDLLWSPLITLPARLPKPGVVTVHDLTVLLYPESHRLKVRLSILPFLSRTLDTARRVVVDSRATAEDLRVNFPECADRVEVVYPGVTADFRPAEANETAATREELGFPDGYLLYVGTLEPRKNVSLLIDVWEALKLDDESVPPLVLAGGYGWGSRRLLRRIERLESLGLTYLGHVDRAFLVRLFQAAAIFVYPSFYEGFGLPPLEAMACGVPTITSDRSSLPEVAGDAALKIDPSNPDSLATALRQLLASPERAAELGERGLRQAQRFNWSDAAAAMETIFLESLQ